MNVLVTGADGFVGNYLLEALKGTHTVTATTLVEGGVAPEAADHVVTLDITDPVTTRNVVTEANPDWIIHLAGFTSVAASFKQPELAMRVNFDGTRNVLEATRSLPTLPRVLAVGSSDEYGIVGSDPVTECSVDDLAPRSPYAESKVAVERLIEDDFLDVAIRTRSFPHTGPGQQLPFVTADFASQIAAIEAGTQEPVIRVGNLSARRDMSDVRDIVRAYLILIEQGTLGEVYNVCSGEAVSIQSILDELLALSTASITVEQDPTKLRPVDLPILLGNNTKLKKATGWQPEIPLNQTLKEVLDFWREQRRFSKKHVADHEGSK